MPRRLEDAWVAHERHVRRVLDERDKLLAALKLVVSSGAPCQREHPSMWDAWQKAIAVIDQVEGR